MAATTTLLGLVTPTQGSLPGVWGDTVNYGITDYVDIAIAGTLAFAGDGAITLANTTGSSSGNSIGATTAQYAIIRVTGTLTTAKIITGPSYSKTYLVVNAATGSTVTFKASGQTGVSIAVGETALVYYNGTDYVKVVGTATAGAAGGSTTQVQYNNAGVLAGITGATSNGTALTLVAPDLGSPASVGTMPAFTLGGTVSGGGNQINNVIIGTSTPLAGAFTTLTASSTATLNTLVSSGATLTGGTINGMTVGATTAAAGAFTTVTASGAITATGAITQSTFGQLTNDGASDFRVDSTSGKTLSLRSIATDMVISADPGVAGSKTVSIKTSGVTPAVFSTTGLAVTGALSATGTLSGGTSGTAYSFSGSAPATSLTLDSSGNLGLGVTPQVWSSIYDAFQIGAQGAFWANATANDVISSANLFLDVGHATKYITNGYASYYSQNAGSHTWAIAPNNTSGAGAAATFTSAMTLDASGNLGIGTTSPSSKLDVRGSVPIIRVEDTAGTGGASFQVINDSKISYFGRENSVGNYFFASSVTPYSTVLSAYGSTAPIIFGHSQPEVYIANGGNVGIGTSSPSTKLQVGDTSDVSIAMSNSSSVTSGNRGTLAMFNSGNSTVGLIRFGAVTDNVGTDIQFFTRPAAGSLTKTMTLDSSGSLQLNKASNETEATAQLLIGGSGYEAYHWLDSTAYYIGQNSSVRSLRIYSNSYTAGVNLASGGTSWGTFSDERLKYDIEPITNGLDKLNSIRCVSYRLKDVDASDSQKKLGVIAQDLVGVVDEVIDITKRHGDETDYMSVRYTELIPVLIKSIQEQQALITQLTARITALETA